MDINKYLLIFLSFLLCLSIGLSYSLKRQREETARLVANQRTLLEKVEFYRVGDSLSAAGVERLLLTTHEFERHFADLRATVADLRIRLGRLQSVAAAATEARYEVKAALRDSLVRRDSLVLRDSVAPLKCLEVHTPYLDVAGCMDGKRFEGTILSRDTLVQVIHRIPHRFWFIRWGTKAIRQEIVSRNPHSRITYSEYIELH